MIHQLFVGRLVAKNGQIKLLRESVNLVNWLRDLPERPSPITSGPPSGRIASADPILTAVHDNGLSGDKGGIVAC
jgi:hypothetical protein